MTDRTELSQRADALAVTFESTLRRVFSAATVDLTAAEASTNGGERATQHIRLVTSDGKTFVLGHANVAERRAELRTLGYSLALSKERFGRELRLPPKEYMRFLELAVQVLEEQGLEVEVVAFGKSAAKAPAPKRRLTLPYAVVTAGSVAAVAAAGWMVLR